MSRASRLLALVLGVLSLSASARAQFDIQSSPSSPSSAVSLSSTTCTGTPGSGTGCAVINVSSYGAASIQATGTWSGTLSFFVSGNGVDYRALNVTASNGSVAVTTATGNALWFAVVGGTRYLKVAFTSYTSGTAVVTLQAALSGGSGGGGGGGGGGGAVTMADGANVALGSTTDTVVTGDADGTLISHLRYIDKAFADLWDTTNHVLKTSVAGGGSAVSISDGSDATQGAKADAKSTATDTTSVTLMQVFKEISFMEQNPATRAVTAISGGLADGALVTLGAKADAKSTATDTTAVTLMQVAKEISAVTQVPPQTFADSAAFTAGATRYTPTGCLYQSVITNFTDGQAGVVACDSTRDLHVTPYDGAGNALAGQRVKSTSLPVAIASDQMGAAGTAAAQVMSIQGIASMTAVKVDGSAVTQPISASSLPLPSGASTAAKQPALGTAGSASADVISIQGVASMTSLFVAGAVASGASDSGNPVKIGGIYNSSPVTLTNAQRGDAQLDANGYLKVNVAAGGASGGTSSSFGSSFPATGTAIGFKDSGGTNLAAGNLDASGYLKVNVAAGSGGNGAASNTGSAVPTQADYIGLNVAAGTLRGQTGVNPSGSIYAAQTDVASIAGTTVDTNSGNKSAGTLRVVFATDQPALTNKLLVTPDSVALPANQSVNGAQWGGTNVVNGGVAGVVSVGGNVANAVTATANPVPVGGVFITSPATLTTGQTATLQFTAAQNAKADLTTVAGTALSTGTGAQGAGTPRMTVATDTATVAGSTVALMGVSATGAAVPANAVYPGAQDASGNNIGDIVCTASKIYDTNTSGNIELVALSGSKHIYICGYEMFAAGTVNLSLVAGTGTACASAISGTPSTGSVATPAILTPAWQFTTQTGKVSAYPSHGWLIDAGSGNALCLKTSAGVAAQVQVFYSQR